MIALLDLLLVVVDNLKHGSGIGVWFSVPGGVISGDATNKSTFMDAMIEHPMFSQIGIDQKKLEEIRAEPPDKEPLEADKKPDCIYLVDARLFFFGAPPVIIPWAVVSISGIAAWGLGRLDHTHFPPD